MAKRNERLWRGVAGCYSLAAWGVVQTPEHRDPSYRWLAHHPDKGEHYFRYLVEAKRFVEQQEQLQVGQK